MKAATGMLSRSSVIMSTLVITLSMLLRHLPRREIILLLQTYSQVNYYLPAMITIVQVFGTFIAGVPGTKLGRSVTFSYSGSGSTLT